MKMHLTVFLCKVRVYLCAHMIHEKQTIYIFDYHHHNNNNNHISCFGSGWFYIVAASADVVNLIIILQTIQNQQ